jgi:hypothetical protein
MVLLTPCLAQVLGAFFMGRGGNRRKFVQKIRLEPYPYGSVRTACMAV